jgi:hypothetical protein
MRLSEGGAGEGARGGTGCAYFLHLYLMFTHRVQDAPPAARLSVCLLADLSAPMVGTYFTLHPQTLQLSSYLYRILFRFLVKINMTHCFFCPESAASDLRLRASKGVKSGRGLHTSISHGISYGGWRVDSRWGCPNGDPTDALSRCIL